MEIKHCFFIGKCKTSIFIHSFSLIKFEEFQKQFHFIIQWTNFFRFTHEICEEETNTYLSTSFIVVDVLLIIL